MTDKIRISLIALLFFLAGGMFGNYFPPVVHAQSGAHNMPPIPKAWGTCKGNLDGNLLIFEATDGTIRVVNGERGLKYQFDRN